ncbi:MAG: DEAD/DEAH box helicase [Acidobacteriota bacterium]|nr:DEAD/DEAH box helicase [Acidobacteriota bacterium]
MRQLMGRSESPCLNRGLERLELGNFDPDLPLYTHQIESIHLSQEGKNLVVATGTGSGKTECFLIPILDDIVRDPYPGVRCIVVYPMNALANDQVSRLRGLLRGLPEVTFGRYTGETPKTRAECSAEDLTGAPPNERLSREEIQADPPQILLTNFAMLEYLLIRPKDVDVFRGRTLKYMVLDEAHTYTGAQGIDVSFLMRRVCRSFADDNVQFFLTSATLADGTGDAAIQAVTRFAETLTGGSFASDSVIFGSRVSPFRGPDAAILTSQLLLAFDTPNDLERLGDMNGIVAFAAEHGFAPPPRAEDTNTGRLRYEWMQSWPAIRTVYRRLSQRPMSVDQLSTEIFGRAGDGEIRATEALLQLGASARPEAGAFPLLPIRFHSFFRGLNGASICLDEAAHGQIGEGFGRLFLEDRRRCEPDCNARVFPLSSCVQCGLPMYVVREAGGEWSAPPPIDTGSTDAGKSFALARPGAVPETENEDGEGGFEEKDVCLTCSRIDSPDSLGEACGVHTVLRLVAFPAAEGHVDRCPRCGAMSGKFDSILQKFRTGDDAATAVLAEELMRGLPADPDGTRLPAAGRRLLAFSDSRQRAAFFAPYLARTSVQSEFEPPIVRAALEAITENGGMPVSTDDVIGRFETHARRRPYCFVPREGQDAVTDYEVHEARAMAERDWARVIREARVRLWSQLCRGPRQRKTWSGVGLIWPFIDMPEGAVAELAAKLGRKTTEVQHLLNELLRYALANKVIAFDSGSRSISAADLGPGPRVATLHFNVRGNVEGRRRFRWTPYAGDRPKPSRSLPAHIAATFLDSDVTPGADVASLLQTVWDALRDWCVIVPFPSAGGEFQVPEKRVLIGVPEQWWACLRCGRLTANDIAGRCFLPGCKGNLKPLAPADIEDRYGRDHYRQRLKLAEPFGLVVKEHTAQLENRVGRAYQEKFVSGTVNVLSTSTTFEMGVDVGRLEAVLLRNVPPTPANYVQRAGRAGRRRSGGAVAVTFCRPLPHDQVHFHDPLQAVAGVVPLPRINLANTRLLQRHLNSLLLGRYLRTLPSDMEWNRVGAFFINPSPVVTLAASFGRHLAEHEAELTELVASVIPSDNRLSSDRAIRESRESLTDKVAQGNVAAELEEFERQEKELLEEVQRPEVDAAKVGKAIQSVRAIRNSLLERDLIGFLADAHWLPSYAFPQDNVRLLVRQQAFTKRMRLERDRELGISEYAPGSEIIADGLLFRSRGVTKRGSAFRVKHYRYCASCRQLGIADGPVAPLCSCGGGSSREFIEPDGFQTSVLDAVEAPNLFRKRPVPSSEIFLVGGAPPEAFEESPTVAGAWLAPLMDGQLFRANQGLRAQKYRLCLDCGVVPERGKSHQSPWGTRCSGQLQALDLGHVFETDTLQLRFDRTWRIPDVSDRIFWRSFSTGFLNAAAARLDIPVRDLGATYRSQSADSLTGELVLYDRVPGGAGYVQRMIAELPSILWTLLETTKNCTNPECDPQGSCYVCLRSYSNQFEWSDLQRVAIVDVFEPNLGRLGLSVDNAARSQSV